MKHIYRFLTAGLVVALLVPSLAVSAFASTVYTFYWFEPPAALSASVDIFPDENGWYFLYDGQLPEGEYIFSCDADLLGSVFRCTSEPFQVLYTTNSDGISVFESVVSFLLESTDLEISQMTSGEVIIGFIDGVTILGVYFDGDISLASYVVSHANLTLVGALDGALAASDIVFTLVEDTFAIITSNPALTVTTGGGLTGVGVLIYKRLRRGV